MTYSVVAEAHLRLRARLQSGDTQAAVTQLPSTGQRLDNEQRVQGTGGGQGGSRQDAEDYNEQGEPGVQQKSPRRQASRKWGRRPGNGA